MTAWKQLRAWMMTFEILSEIRDIETIAAGQGVYIRRQLERTYRTLPDIVARSRNMIRVIDEDQSEPDGYLYPAAMFAPIELPEVAERVLLAAGD